MECTSHILNTLREESVAEESFAVGSA